MAGRHKDIRDAKPVTVRALRAALADVPSAYLDMEIKVWLPGSLIYLVGQPWLHADNLCVCVEGNVEEGSALYRLIAS